MSLLDLPIEIHAIIFTYDLDTFLAALKVPGIGPRLCHEYIQNYAKNVFIIIVEDEWCTKYYLGDKLHHVGGPALIRKEGWTIFTEPFKHRYNSPEDYTDDEQIYNSGKMICYRNMSPIIHVQKLQSYYIHGKLHNDHMPAIIYSDGTQEFWKNGEFMYRFSTCAT
jgi:hypothetical protein